MSSWTTAGTWLLHCGVGGGLLLLLTCFLVSRARQPAIKQRLGEWGLAAALVVALLSLVGPAWLIVAWPAADAPPIEAPPSVPVFDVFLPDEPGQPGRADWPPVAPDVLAEPIPPLPPEVAALPRRVEGPAIPWWRSLAADLLPGLVALYALGAAFLLGRWLLGHAVLIRLLRRATPAPA
ncbi:MAG TPA: hypothetical protein VEL76_04460, partial [Gemmataceae bacterium]|nr:hypothetical protein [Gemmataceae bacterium]